MPRHFRYLKPFSRHRFESLGSGLPVEFLVYRLNNGYYEIRYWNGLKSKLSAGCAMVMDCQPITWRDSMHLKAKHRQPRKRGRSQRVKKGESNGPHAI